MTQANKEHNCSTHPWSRCFCHQLLWSLLHFCGKCSSECWSFIGGCCVILGFCSRHVFLLEFSLICIKLSWLGQREIGLFSCRLFRLLTFLVFYFLFYDPFILWNFIMYFLLYFFTLLFYHFQNKFTFLIYLFLFICSKVTKVLSFTSSSINMSS